LCGRIGHMSSRTRNFYIVVQSDELSQSEDMRLSVFSLCFFKSSLVPNRRKLDIRFKSRNNLLE